MLKFVFVAIFGVITLISLCESEYSCSSGFNVYFILDRSKSVKSFNFQNQTVQFVQDILHHLTSPNLRASFIVFADRADTIMPLTQSRADIAVGIEKLKKVTTRGRTYLEFGLDIALRQIKKEEGTLTASFVFILTDGELSEKNSFSKADTVRSLGAEIFVIGVNNYKLSQLKQLANKPSTDYVFTAKNYKSLTSITNKIVDKACIEVTSIEPDSVCVGESYDVTLTGRGFRRRYDADKIICNFKLNKTQNHITKPTHVTDTQLKCSGIVIDTIGSFVMLEVSVNGKTFVSTDIRVTAVSCEKSNRNSTSAIVGILFGLLLLALLLLWWFWMLLPCVSPPKSADSQLLPVEADTATKKWPTVDASFYGGGGVGGVKPVRVKWGNKGATEAGNKLTKTPDAKIISAEDNNSHSKNSSKKSCFSRTKSAIVSMATSCYAKVAALRPQKGGSSKLYSTS